MNQKQITFLKWNWIWIRKKCYHMSAVSGIEHTSSTASLAENLNIKLNLIFSYYMNHINLSLKCLDTLPGALT